MRVHYVGYIEETGEEFDTSKLFGDSDYSKPLAFRIGDGTVVPGFDAAVRSMCLGESCHVKIKAAAGCVLSSSPRWLPWSVPPVALMLSRW